MVQSRLSIRIDLGNGERIGPGKIALLKAIEKTGSISAAAKALGMSYPRAWKLTQNLNASFKKTIVDIFQGGPSRGGSKLTPAGLELIILYDQITIKAKMSAQSDLKNIETL